jgi:predicted sulfurtransferase
LRGVKVIMKYYKNPLPKPIEEEDTHPCDNCKDSFDNSSMGTDEYGEYVELISCKDECTKYKQHLNNFGKSIYSEYIDEEQMKRLHTNTK